MTETATNSTIAQRTDLSRFATDAAQTRPATRIAFQGFCFAYNRAARAENALPLEEVVKRVCFVENPLDVLDLLRSDDEARLVRETVGEGYARLHSLELTGWDWSILIVVGPEALELIEARLRYVEGAATTYGGVERFAL